MYDILSEIYIHFRFVFRDSQVLCWAKYLRTFTALYTDTTRIPFLLIEWDMIVVTVFLSILNQIVLNLVQNQRESVTMIISHSIWEEMETWFSQCRENYWHDFRESRTRSHVGKKGILNFKLFHTFITFFSTEERWHDFRESRTRIHVRKKGILNFKSFHAFIIEIIGFH